jgi:hypothetical protein
MRNITKDIHVLNFFNRIYSKKMKKVCRKCQVYKEEELGTVDKKERYLWSRKWGVVYLYAERWITLNDCADCECPYALEHMMSETTK